MNLLELREQLQENLITYLSDKLSDEIIEDYIVSDVCQIVIDTFDNTFYAGSPLDKSPQN
jgi:hypothetical protein